MPETYLEKARKAEEAGLKSTNPQLREGWLEVARSYRLLANAQHPSLRRKQPEKGGKAPG